MVVASERRLEKDKESHVTDLIITNVAYFSPCLNERIAQEIITGVQFANYKYNMRK